MPKLIVYLDISIHEWSKKHPSRTALQAAFDAIYPDVHYTTAQNTKDIDYVIVPNNQHPVLPTKLTNIPVKTVTQFKTALRRWQKGSVPKKTSQTKKISKKASTSTTKVSKTKKPSVAKKTEALNAIKVVVYLNPATVVWTTKDATISSLRRTFNSIYPDVLYVTSKSASVDFIVVPDRAPKLSLDEIKSVGDGEASVKTVTQFKAALKRWAKGSIPRTAWSKKQALDEKKDTKKKSVRKESVRTSPTTPIVKPVASFWDLLKKEDGMPAAKPTKKTPVIPPVSFWGDLKKEYGTPVAIKQPKKTSPLVADRAFWQGLLSASPKPAPKLKVEPIKMVKTITDSDSETDTDVEEKGMEQEEEETDSEDEAGFEVAPHEVRDEAEEARQLQKTAEKAVKNRKYVEESYSMLADKELTLLLENILEEQTEGNPYDTNEVIATFQELKEYLESKRYILTDKDIKKFAKVAFKDSLKARRKFEDVFLHEDIFLHDT